MRRSAFHMVVGCWLASAWYLQPGGFGASAQEAAPAAAQRDAKSDTESPAIKDNDVLAELQAINRGAPPPSDLRPGSVTPRQAELPKVTADRGGFTIQMPSRTPVPTPAVYEGRLIVSGGFSSTEYYCFNAATGKLIWAVDLSDDGPSSGVISDDTILFGTESCTLFALDIASGKMRWSYYLGDPLMSIPTIHDGRVFAVYPSHSPKHVKQQQAAPPAKDPAGKGDLHRPLSATHVLACFDLKTGKVLWQRWIDTECMSAPIAVDGQLHLATLSGTLYRFDQADGTPHFARRMQATSAPVIGGDHIFLTRRADQEGRIGEAILICDRRTSTAKLLTAARPAPYLDQAVQRMSAATGEADAAEAQNAIGGGFGGGFGKPGSGDEVDGDGFFAVPAESQSGGEEGADDEPGESADAEDVADEAPQQVDAEEAADVQVEVDEAAEDDPFAGESADLLAETQQKAAGTIGLGNVSTLQAFQGSRLLHWGKRNFNCMGDVLVCTSSETGEQIWTLPLEGNLEQAGGHLAAAPVAAGKWLFLATLDGKIHQIEPGSGRVHRSFDIEGAMRFSPVIDQGRIYATTQNGKVVCIDTGDPDLTGWPAWGRNAAHTNVYD